MVATAPHFLLLTETHCFADDPSAGGFWRFVLRQIDGSGHLEVSDTEPGVTGERLHLLAVIRGLEALEQPSQVTLMTPSRYITRGIRRDLASWKEMNWMWERFGELHAIKHSRLWQRLDIALQFHSVQCRSLKIDQSISRNGLTNRFGARERLNKIGVNVLDSCVKAAQKMRNRMTVESMARQYA